MSKVENLISQSGLSDDKQLALKQSFVDFERISNFWQEQAEKIIVTDINDTDMMVLAKEGRKALSEKRIAIEKLRKILKDASLQEGRMIDTIAKELTGLITPTEEYLKLQETFAQRMEEQRIAKLVEDRKKAFEPYGVDTRFYEFATMDEMMFETLLLGAKTKFEKEEENNRLLEESRLRKIEEDKKQAEEQRLENIRLKALAEEQEKKINELRNIEAERIEREFELELQQFPKIKLVNTKNTLPPNIIVIGDSIKIDAKYFYYREEKIEDINNVYQLFTDYLKNNK